MLTGEFPAVGKRGEGSLAVRSANVVPSIVRPQPEDHRVLPSVWTPKGAVSLGCRSAEAALPARAHSCRILNCVRSFCTPTETLCCHLQAAGRGGRAVPAVAGGPRLSIPIPSFRTTGKEPCAVDCRLLEQVVLPCLPWRAGAASAAVRAAALSALTAAFDSHLVAPASAGRLAAEHKLLKVQVQLLLFAACRSRRSPSTGHWAYLGMMYILSSPFAPGPLPRAQRQRVGGRPRRRRARCAAGYHGGGRRAGKGRSDRGVQEAD